MYGVELYAAVRLAVVDEGLSHHEAGRRFGIDRRTVKKMLSYSAPPGYRRTKPVRRPKLDRFTGIVDAILEADTDPDVPRKQRHTAHRIFERLRDEHGFTGGYTIVKDYVRARRQSTREAFVPLHHPPGHAQVDFGEAVVEVGGRREKVAFFCLILPHSNVWFVKAYPRETTEAFLDGHVSAFAFLGGLPRSILYDNTTLAVARILGDGTRRRTQAFTHLQSHYLFRDRFGRPGKGNDKGKVEALVKTARRRFMVPIPKVHDLSVLNQRLLARCLERLDALEAGGQAAALLADLDALRDLPAVPFEACEHVPGQISSTALVRYRLVDYSAPAAHAHKKVMVKGYVDRVEIALGAEIVARHRRSYIPVLEVTGPDPASRRAKGKDDALDAISAAEAARTRRRVQVAKDRSGTVEALRVLRTTRKTAIKCRRAALQQLHNTIVAAPEEVRDQVRNLTRMQRLRTCAAWRPDTVGYRDPVVATKLSLKSLARRILDINDEIAELDRFIVPLVEELAPSLLELEGVGTENAGAVMVAVGDNPDRLRSEASFAMMCGVCPIPASSGKTQRHRLNRGGNRQANSALHMVVVCRMRTDERTRAYVARRTLEGLSKREVMRCLKRYVAREIYRVLTAPSSA